MFTMLSMPACASSSDLDRCEQDRLDLQKQIDNPDCNRVIWQCFAKEHNRMKK
jgi:hypothetical protein